MRDEVFTRKYMNLTASTSLSVVHIGWHTTLPTYSCARCAADVKALTLTNLQPSYIVRRRAEAHAMLTVYETRYNSTIFAQLTRACKVVMDNPRHGPENTLI